MKQSFLNRLVVSLFLILAFGHSSLAKANFVTSSGSLDYSKLAIERQIVAQRKLETLKQIENDERYRKGSSELKVSEKIANNRTLQTYDLLLNWMDQLLSRDLPASEKTTLSKKVLETSLALKSDIDPENTEKQILKHVRAFTSKMSISKAASREATNLVNPSTGKIFSAREIAQMKAQGIDLSQFDPPANNGVLELIDPATANISDRFLNGKNGLHQGITIEYPSDNVVYYEEVRKKQSKPKLTVFSVDSKGLKKREYKLKLAMELHGEPTSAALSNALGIYSDLTRYVRDVKLVLGKTTFEQLKRDWNSYYGSYDLEKLIKQKGQDASGNFVIFKDGLLEPELDETKLNRVGPWYWGSFDHKQRREFRGLFVFNLWIHNTDLKEGENNKLLIKTNARGQHSLYYLQQDLGFSFGRYFRERPTDFPWTLVEDSNQERVQFNFRNFQVNTGFDHVTYADAKWMVRRIAKLSRKQIEEAVSIGQWPNQAPYNYRELIVEKLIHRRNQLVQAFGLEGEVSKSGQVIAAMPVNRSIEKQAGPAPKSGVPGYTVDFSPEIKSMVVDPLMEKLKNGLKSGALKLVGSVNKISIEPQWLGWDEGVISQVLLSVNRTVVENPDSKGDQDGFLVRDELKLGARLGYGLVLSGDAAYVRGLSLIYPVATKEAGLNAPASIVEVIKEGYAGAQSKLPRGHILMAESFVEGRARLKLEGGAVTLGYEGTASRIDLSRTLLSRKQASKILLLEDESLYTELAQKIYTKLVLFKIHHFKWSDQKGVIDRNAYELDLNSATLADSAIFKNDFVEIKRRGQLTKMSSEFWQRTSKINLFGFWQKTKELRRDLVDVSKDSGRGGLSTSTQLIVTKGSQEAWRTMLNGEDHLKSVRFSSAVSRTEDRLLDPVLKLSYTHFDQNVTSKELNSGYLQFIDGLTGKQQFLNFTPNLHALQGWGELTIQTHVEISEEGIMRLMQSAPQTVLEAIAQEAGLPAMYLVTPSPYQLESPDEKVMHARATYRLTDLQATVKDLLSHWKSIQDENSTLKRSEALVAAFYRAGLKVGNSYSPLILRALLKLAGEENTFIQAQIGTPEGVENKLPGKVATYNQTGTDRRVFHEHERFLFNMTETLAVYHAF